MNDYKYYSNKPRYPFDEYKEYERAERTGTFQSSVNVPAVVQLHLGHASISGVFVGEGEDREIVYGPHDLYKIMAQIQRFGGDSMAQQKGSAEYAQRARQHYGSVDPGSFGARLDAYCAPYLGPGKTIAFRQIEDHGRELINYQWIKTDGTPTGIPIPPSLGHSNAFQQWALDEGHGDYLVDPFTYAGNLQGASNHESLFVVSFQNAYVTGLLGSWKPEERIPLGFRAIPATMLHPGQETLSMGNDELLRQDSAA